MYKVFVNEKKLTLSNAVADTAKNLRFEGTSTLEIAVDLLENTSCKELNIYGDNTEAIWKEFQALYRTIEAAGGVVHNSENKILFIYRLGKWDLPKGKLEKGERPEQASLREVEEETGLDNLLLEDFLGATYHMYRERNGERILKKTYWYRMRYTGFKIPTPQVEEGISEAKWKSEAEISSDVLSATFQNIRLILDVNKKDQPR